MSLQLRRKVHESVVYIDRDSAPRIIPSGEDFILEDLPIGTRVIHPKMTEWEMRRMVGDKIFKEFHPDRYYNHDAEWEDGLVTLGETKHHEPLRINRRCAESDLLIYCNINLTPMDGGHKSVAVGLCDYESLRAHHEPQTIRDSNSYMDPAHSELNHKIVRLGQLLDKHVNVFHIETALNN